MSKVIITFAVTGSIHIPSMSPMLADTYEPATMKVLIWQKDMTIISDFAMGFDCPTPLFDACASLYTAATAPGSGGRQ